MKCFTRVKGYNNQKKGQASFLHSSPTLPCLPSPHGPHYCPVLPLKHTTAWLNSRQAVSDGSPDPSLFPWSISVRKLPLLSFSALLTCKSSDPRLVPCKQDLRKDNTSICQSVRECDPELSKWPFAKIVCVHSHALCERCIHENGSFQLAIFID